MAAVGFFYTQYSAGSLMAGFMKQFSGRQSKRDRTAGIAAALILHAIVLLGLWHYQIVPPPSEALTVFVSFINPAQPVAPETIAEPVAPKKLLQVAPKQPAPVPVKQEIARSPAPAEPTLLSSAAPVTSPAAPVVPAPQPAKALSLPVTVSSTAVSVPVQVASLPSAVAAPRSVHLAGELSLTCPERTPPAYPKLSQRLGEQGKTVLRVELDELGQVANVTVTTTSGFPRLDEAAITAVKSWHCGPAKHNGLAVRSVAAQPFTFNLKGR
jgi:periplasmic protein TonB